MFTITCARCSHHVKAETPDNGEGLACETFSNSVMGHYGSKYDGEVFIIHNPNLVPPGFLCDGCVDLLIHVKAIIHEPNG